MSRSPRQTNFGAGELDPLLWGRTDLPIFAKGLRRCRNFFISKHGAAVSRPGTEYVATTKAINAAASGLVLARNQSADHVKLVPFFAGDDVAYVLAFGHLYVRFFAKGEAVLDGGGNPYELVTPYGLNELSELKYAQTGDVLTLVNPVHDARELRINGPTNWVLSVVDFTPPPAGFYIPSLATSVSLDLAVDRHTLPSGSTDEPAQEWQWMFTVVLRRKSDGAVIESMGQLVINSFDSSGASYAATVHALITDIPGNLIAVYQDKPVSLKLEEFPDLVDDFSGYELVAYNVYRGRGGVFGWLGQTDSTTFVDVGEAPDYAIQPPQGTQPFGTATEPIGSHETRRLDRPTTVGYFQERRVFAGSTLNPDKVHASKTGDYLNYDVRLALDVSGEALDFTLAARRREEIRWQVTRQRMLLGTGVGIWSVGGSQGSPIDFDNIDARVEDETGATTLQPIVADGVVLYARAKGIGVRALVSDGQQYSYQGVDVSQLAQHLFLGKANSIIDWCFAQDPWGLVWAVREDGALLTLTYERDSWAWARHDTDGVVESICAIPEDDEDAVYLVVARTVNGQQLRYIERMTSRVRRYPTVDVDGEAQPDPTYPLLWADDVCLDCAFEYRGAPTTSFTGLGALEGEEVYVTARGMPSAGPFTVAGGAIAAVYDVAPPTNGFDSLGGPIFVAYVGLLFNPELESLDIAAGESRIKKKLTARIGFEVDNSVGLEVGQDFEHMDEWEQRSVDDGFHSVSVATKLVDMPVDGAWDQSARAALRQTSPTPVTVVGITREVDFEE